MVLPEQAEKKTACTVPAGDISLWKATPAELLFLIVICHCHFSPAQHTKVTTSEQCLHPHVCPNTLSLHPWSAPTTVGKYMTIWSLILAFIYPDGA